MADCSNVYVLGLDLGTTTIKATLFDEIGHPVSEDAVDEELLIPEQDYIEQDANQWYTDAISVIRNTVEKAKVSPARVLGIGISSQAITIVPVNKELGPLANAINWMDNRPVEGWNNFIKAVGSDYIYSITGKTATEDTPKAVGKMIWYRENMPDVYNQTSWFLMPAEFLIAKLTGEIITDHSLAAGSMLYSIFEKRWSEVLFKAARISMEKLPKIAWAGEKAGYLTPEAARDCGLTTGCMVAVGGQDQKVAAYGVNVQKGIPTCSIGTCAAFEFLLDEPKFHPNRILQLCPFVENDKWVLEGCITTAGGAIKWIRDTICCGMSYRDMDMEATIAYPGCGGAMFYPYLAKSSTQNANLVNDGNFKGLGLHTTRGDLIRAVYEGIAYEMRLNIDAAETVVGKINELRAFAGGSRSDILCSIIANVTGRIIKSYSYPEMGNLGAAKLAAKCIDLDTEKFGIEILNDTRDIVPDKEKAFYDERFNKYIKGKEKKEE